MVEEVQDDLEGEVDRLREDAEPESDDPVRLAVTREREACALLAEGLAYRANEKPGRHAARIATMIRARK